MVDTLKPRPAPPAITNRPASGRKRYIPRYALSVSAYDRLLKQQDYKCALCDRLFKEGRGYEAVNIDRNPDSHVIYGMLCGRCAAIVGLWRNRAKIRHKALEYIRLTGLISKVNNATTPMVDISN